MREREREGSGDDRENERGSERDQERDRERNSERERGGWGWGGGGAWVNTIIYYDRIHGLCSCFDSLFPSLRLSLSVSLSLSLSLSLSKTRLKHVKKGKQTKTMFIITKHNMHIVGVKHTQKYARLSRWHWRFIFLLAMILLLLS